MAATNVDAWSIELDEERFGVALKDFEQQLVDDAIASGRARRLSYDRQPTPKAPAARTLVQQCFRCDRPPDNALSGTPATPTPKPAIQAASPAAPKTCGYKPAATPPTPPVPPHKDNPMSMLTRMAKLDAEIKRDLAITRRSGEALKRSVDGLLDATLARYERSGEPVPRHLVPVIGQVELTERQREHVRARTIAAGITDIKQGMARFAAEAMKLYPAPGTTARLSYERGSSSEFTPRQKEYIYKRASETGTTNFEDAARRFGNDARLCYPG